MEIIYERNILDIIILLLYVFGVVTLTSRYKQLSKKIYSLALLAGVMHLVFTIVYYYYTFSNVADAKGYFLNATYRYSSFGDTSFSDGTSFIDALLFPLIHYLGVGYLGCFLIFSLFSLLGIYKLYEILLNVRSYLWTNWFYLLLLPSMHFWTASIGKDSLVFYSICCLLHSYYFRKPLKSYILPIILIGFLRFYVLAFLGVGLFIALIFLSNKIKYSHKAFLTVVFVAGVVLIMPFFFESINVRGVDEIGNRQAIIQEANMEGGGAVDLSNSNIVIKWFSYVFRPFLFEANSMFTLIASIENILWILIFYTMYINIRKRRTRNLLSPFFWICFICIFTVTVPASFILSNLGIAARQKIMIVPFLFVTFFILLDLNRKLNIERKLNQ